MTSALLARLRFGACLSWLPCVLHLPHHSEKEVGRPATEQKPQDVVDDPSHAPKTPDRATMDDAAAETGEKTHAPGTSNTDPPGDECQEHEEDGRNARGPAGACKAAAKPAMKKAKSPAMKKAKAKKSPAMKKAKRA